MKFLIALQLLFISVLSWTQSQTLVYNIQWSEADLTCFPCDLKSDQSGFESHQNKLLNVRGAYDFTYDVLSVETEKIDWSPLFETKYIAESSDLNVTFGNSANENYAALHVSPLYKKNGSLYFVKSVKIQVNYTPRFQMQNRAATFASESVLKSGNWYKFGISTSGMYQLTYPDLEAAGISMSSLNPTHINMYANQKAELPTSNSSYHPDDLVKNSIFISGESDGSFDSEDYILFYAVGPEVVTNDIGNGFKMSNNKNDSLTYVYLNISSSNTPQRISSTANSSASSTHSVSTCNATVYYETDEQNLLESGTTWVGDEFDVVLSYDYNITLEGVVTSEIVTLETNVVSKMVTGTGSFNVSVNNSSVDNVACTVNTSSYSEGTHHVSTSTFNTSSSDLAVNLSLSRSSASTKGWLNRFTFNYRRSLNASLNQFLIRDWNSVGTSNVATYSVSNATTSTQVWEVTDPTAASKISGTLSGSTYTFKQNADSLRSFVVFNTSQTLTPSFIEQVSNQNLHALSQADIIIITYGPFESQANRLASLHQSLGQSVHVVDVQKVYNEFSCGMADPVSIRWFLKMFYDRAGGIESAMPKSLLLFGDGSYDPLNRLDENTSFIPTYRSVGSEINGASLSIISSYTSDDFFGILDDSEAMNASDLIDVGVGRIPAKTLEEATQVVDKLEHYMMYGSTLFPNVTGTADEDGYVSTFGDWRTRSVLIADDEDYAKFVDDCEAISDSVENAHPSMNTIKIYLDAYQQVSSSGGQRYPQVVEAINQYMSQGALVFNYVGHGGEDGLSLERIITIPMIEAWTNVHKLPVFISATCEFSRFDNPEQTSAGEIMLLSPNGGAVSMLTTTRLVYISTNSTLLKNLYSVLYDEMDGEPLTLGEIIRQSKNLTAGDNNMRNFTLLGDPALILGKPRPQIVADSLNHVDIQSISIDTIKALSKITISGHIEDYLGNTLSSYNGIVYPTVYDKVKWKETLGQDTDSPVRSFDTQNNVIYRGKATVKNGFYSFSFITPKDIDYDYGKGKLSFYAQNTVADKMGFDTMAVVGGINPDGLDDDIGPEIELYMNDENFVNGGLTDESPLFIAKVSDENGINTTGNGVGHDITVILDANTADPITLNNFYEADLDTYKSGEVNYQFTDIEVGEHTLTFKVWDVNNNSSEAVLDFVVVEEEEVTISHLLNYPNPFTTYTEFYFEHNQVYNNLEAKIEIFTVSGKLVKTIFRQVNTFAYRSEGIEWDGKDEYGDRLARGVYVYRLTIETPAGDKAEKIEKLVIL